MSTVVEHTLCSRRFALNPNQMPSAYQIHVHQYTASIWAMIPIFLVLSVVLASSGLPSPFQGGEQESLLTKEERCPGRTLRRRQVATSPGCIYERDRGVLRIVRALNSAIGIECGLDADWPMKEQGSMVLRSGCPPTWEKTLRLRISSAPPSALSSFATDISNDTSKAS